MEKNIKLFTVVLVIFLVNAFGLILRYFELDRYIILFGFRFYLSLTLPFLIIIRFAAPKLKELFIHPSYNKTFQPLGWIFLPLIILFSVLYFTKKIDIGDPDYFYEFGLSSIFDYPIYIVWNLPQLLMFSSFLILIQPAIKFRFSNSFLVILFLFAFEFIPFNKTKINFIDLSCLLLLSISVSFLIKFFQNVYWISIIVFTILWTNLLAFGNSSQAMIHLLFAARYDSWDGFFEIPKNWQSYLLPAQLAFTTIIISFSTLFKKSKS